MRRSVACSFAVLAAGCAGSSSPTATAPHVERVEPVTGAGATTITHTAPPELLVHVDAATDSTRVLRDGTTTELTEIVRRAIASGDYATAWPSGLPCASELTANRARAFIVAATVQSIEIDRTGSRASIRCRVGIRVAPWYGTDGGEQWEASRAANAIGSARATSGLREESIRNGVRDCVLEVGQTVAMREIVPFLGARRDRK